ncbi:MAG: glycine zipper domain-containing protein [Pirellulaceae bacterium]|nr:DUF1269 domain-containing protein [Planctomycetaceae bacterium]
MKSIAVIVVLLVSLISSGCKTGSYRERGTGLGAVGGALAGAAIGEHNDRPLAGAAIGTAIGALAGSAIGDSMDQDMEQRAASVARLQGKLTMADVIQLSQSGLGDNVIVRQISRDGVRHPLNAQDLIVLSRAGVSDRVIEELQSVGSRDMVVAQYPRVIMDDGCYISPPVVRHWHRPHPEPVHARGLRFGVHLH